MHKVYHFVTISCAALLSMGVGAVPQSGGNLDDFAVGSTGISWRAVAEEHAMGYKLQYSLEGTAYVPIATFQLLGNGRYYYAFAPQSGYYQLQLCSIDGKHYDTPVRFYTDKRMGETDLLGRARRARPQPTDPLYHVSE